MLSRLSRESESHEKSGGDAVNGLDRFEFVVNFKMVAARSPVSTLRKASDCISRR